MIRRLSATNTIIHWYLQVYSLCSAYRQKIRPHNNFHLWPRKECYAHLTSWTKPLVEKLPLPQLVNKFPNILWNLGIHYHFHNSLPLVSILCQMNPVHAHPSHFFKVAFNIIFLSMSRSSKWPLSFRFPHKNLTGNSSPTMWATSSANFIPGLFDQLSTRNDIYIYIYQSDPFCVASQSDYCKNSQFSTIQ